LLSQPPSQKPTKKSDDEKAKGEKPSAETRQMEVEFQLAIPKPIGPRSLPLIVKPKKVLVNVVDTFVDMPSSILARTANNKGNLALFHGRRFKVGWGPRTTGMFLNSEHSANKLQMVHNLYELATFFNGRPVKDQSAQVVQPLQLTTCKIDDDFEDSVVDHLKIQLKYGQVHRTADSDCPFFEAAGGTDVLSEHFELAKSLVRLNELAAYSATVWSLMHALWGYCYELDDIEELSHKDVMFRRDNFSEWIEGVVTENGGVGQAKDSYLDQLLALVMSHKVSDACELAFTNNDVNLAMLLAQISGEFW
jgi:nuclear pore complex protein Nup98-Nup96